MKKTYLIFPVFISFIPLCFSQTGVDTLEYLKLSQPFNTLFSNFDKQLNTYFLNTGLNLSGQFSNLEVSLFENFRSTLFRSATQSIRDEQYFILNGKYQLNKIYNIGISANSSILSDDRNIQLNQATINYVTLYNEIKPWDSFLLSPFGGYSTNKQVGVTDNGPVYGFEGLIDNLTYPDFIINSTFRFRNEDILPRRNLNRYFNLSVANPFNPLVTNFIVGRYSSGRKDFYFPADSITSSKFDIINNIESRTESIFFTEDRLRYKNFLDDFDLEILGGVNWRTIDREKRYKTAEVQSTSIFDTKIEELILSLESSLFYSAHFFDGSIRINISERDEKHITKNFEGVDESFFEQRSELESRKNNNSSRATIAFAGNIKFSETDNLILSLYHNKLRYDTPSPDNDDDRDEILSILRLRYSKKLSPFFRAFINTEATISHVVYIFASRSSNNNFNRVLRFAAGGYYQGANVSSLNTFEVSANYTVYDFEDISSSLKSFSFRQFTATDSTRISLTKKLALVITGYIKLSENADLNWGEFSERPTRFLREIFADPMLIINYNSSHLGIGMRYFSLNTYNYVELTKVPDSRYLSIGPIIEILFNFYSSLYLKLNGWYEFISINDVPDRERANLVMSLNWNF